MKVPARGPLERGVFSFCFLPFFRLGEAEGEEGVIGWTLSKARKGVIGVAI